jgi:SWI/SNF-related matrix-associated actin-dependent regulator 1 of chromatin subfamily A
MANPISRIVKPKCPFCGVDAEVVKESKIGNKTFLKLACGHTSIKETMASVEDNFFDSFVSYRGEHLLPFQVDGAKFAIEANARVLIADDTGLGKTVQAFAVIKQKQLKRGIIVCKAGLRDQWEHQYYNWVGEDYGLVRVIREPRIDKIHKAFPITIVSFESLHRCPWLIDDDLLSKMDFVIIDEVQKIKSLSAKMTQAVRRLCHNPSADRHIPHVIGLSGTPIKNNAAEYFPILNILRPDIFNNYNNFTWRYVDSYFSGQYRKFGGLASDMIDDFRAKTEKFIIRRTREQVMPELPLIFRHYLYNNLSDKVKDEFDRLVEQFQNEYNSGKRDMGPGSNLLAIITMMRYVIGIAKVDETLDFLEEFLQTTTRKLVVFVHHHDVAKLLDLKLRKLEDGDGQPLSDSVLNIVGLTPDKRTPVLDEFKDNDKKRVLIASTLASGEGLNLQYCSDAVILEFEWNYANEYQAETRFTRIGFTVTEENQNKVTITRPIALGTMDEWMMELKERKKVYSDQALDGKEGDMSDSSVMKEMAEKIMSIGTKKFSLKDHA